MTVGVACCVEMAGLTGIHLRKLQLLLLANVAILAMSVTAVQAITETCRQIGPTCAEVMEKDVFVFLQALQVTQAVLAGEFG